MSTMKTISKGGIWNTEKKLKAEGVNLNKKTYSRDEVRKIFKTASGLKGTGTARTGWQANQMANRTFAANSQLETEQTRERGGANQRLRDLQQRLFRKKDDSSDKLYSSKSRLAQKKIDEAKKSANPKTASATTPTLHGVPTGGNVVLRSASTPERLQPTVIMAEQTASKPSQFDEPTNSGSDASTGEPSISDEEFNTIKDKAKEVSGTDLLS
jgi:hypothetical protein